MENNKYYIPKIEEFHIGFEYEYHEHFGKDFGKWNKYTIENNTIISNISELIASGSIRVKYLDKEDIESLGFKCTYDNYPRELEFNNGTYTIYWNPEEMKLIIHLNEYMNHDEYWGDYGVWFTIKNKSELKKLLTQLGIEYASKSN